MKANGNRPGPKGPGRYVCRVYAAYVPRMYYMYRSA